MLLKLDLNKLFCPVFCSKRFQNNVCKVLCHLNFRVCNLKQRFGLQLPTWWWWCRFETRKTTFFFFVFFFSLFSFSRFVWFFNHMFSLWLVSHYSYCWPFTAALVFCDNTFLVLFISSQVLQGFEPLSFF